VWRRWALRSSPRAQQTETVSVDQQHQACLVWRIAARWRAPADFASVGAQQCARRAWINRHVWQTLIDPACCKLPTNGNWRRVAAAPLRPVVGLKRFIRLADRRRPSIISPNVYHRCSGQAHWC